MGLKAFSDVDELMKAAHLEGKSRVCYSQRQHRGALRERKEVKGERKRCVPCACHNVLKPARQG